MKLTMKGKGAALIQGAAVAAVASLLGSEVAMAGADPTFHTALASFTGVLEGSGGEIITVQSNRNCMRTREAILASDLLPGLERAFPICTPGASDTARFDEALELLHLGGRPLHHAMLMMIPEAWENNSEMDPAQRAFYRFHASVMEPWDGPASVTFTDGTIVGLPARFSTPDASLPSQVSTFAPAPRGTQSITVRMCGPPSRPRRKFTRAALSR